MCTSDTIPKDLFKVVWWLFSKKWFLSKLKKVTLVYKWPELYETSLTNGCLNILRKVVNFLTLYPNLFLVNFQLE
jgi:intergrase/recombinase